MPVTFGKPLFLLLLAAIPIALLVGRRLLARPRTVSRVLAVALRIAGILLLALAVSELQWRSTPDAMEVVFAVDQSLSIPRRHQQLALEVVNAARKTMDPARDRARLVVFGDAALLEGSLERDREVTATSSIVGRSQTNVAAALELALASFEPDARRRIVLISDGNETTGDARAAIARARLMRTRVDVVPLDYEYNDLRLDRLELPNEAKLGDRIRVRAVVDATKPAPAKIHLLVDGAAVETRAVELAAGPNVQVFEIALTKPGFFRVSARVEAAAPEDDALPQNNEAAGCVYVKGASSVLHVRADGAPPSPLAAALAQDGLTVIEVVPALVPQHATGLQGYDAIILDDVPREAFSNAQLDAIEFAVANEGTGLAMVGGEGSFGAGGWAGSPVEKALPVECDLSQSTILPSLALALCLDKSGSMGETTADGARKIDLVRQGAALTSRYLARGDQLGVLGFDDHFDWVLPMARVDKRASLDPALRRLEPGGGTVMAPAIEECVRALERAQASVKHMIVLTDGLSDPGDWGAIMARCIHDKITVSTVGVGADIDQNLLKYLASAGGGKAYLAKVASELPRIFLRETQRVARPFVVSGEFVPRRARDSEILKGIDGVPALEAFVATEPKPRAEIPLVGPKGEPILAHWQYGAGKAIAFTGDAQSRWAKAWVSWGGFRSFWSQAVHWVSKEVEESSFQVSTRADRGRGRISVDAIDDQGRLQDGLTVEGEVRSPKDDRIRVALRQVGPARYEGDFALGETGAYTVSLLTRDKAGRRRPSLTTSLVVPYSDEYRRASSDRAKLEAIARAGDGAIVEPWTVLDGPKGNWRGFFAREDTLTVEAVIREQWVLLLTLALGCFLLDVVVRRVAIDRDLWGRRKPAAAAKVVPRDAAPTNRLLEAKRRAQRRIGGPGA